MIIFAIYTFGIFAQENYYKSTKTFYENGYTYQCDVLEGAGFVTLYNKENKLSKTEQLYRNTGTPTSMKDRKKVIEEETWTKPKCFSIVNNAFSVMEKQRLKDCEFTIMMYIDSDSGKVLEVKFQFVNFRCYATIPVSVFRKIEVELKKNIWFTPTTDGKKLNYIFLSWMQQPE